MSHISELSQKLNNLLIRRSKTERSVSDYAQLASRTADYSDQYIDRDLDGMTDEERVQHSALYNEAFQLQHTAAQLNLASIDRQIAEVARLIGEAA